MVAVVLYLFIYSFCQVSSDVTEQFFFNVNGTIHSPRKAKLTSYPPDVRTPKWGGEEDWSWKWTFQMMLTVICSAVLMLGHWEQLRKQLHTKFFHFHCVFSFSFFLFSNHLSLYRNGITCGDERGVHVRKFCKRCGWKKMQLWLIKQSSVLNDRQTVCWNVSCNKLSWGREISMLFLHHSRGPLFPLNVRSTQGQKSSWNIN